ncbi:Exocyst complex component Exo70 protein [Dioscorea alata]|uniref:Exocyst complex component Exo70 protein n=1 Tax=Dioscorea alata TaxID=55571 RepID=A0ACB7WCJ5_DIOAL|nr:Exocyst complex component Exo70 protein [Dioscorea alata]
MDSSPPPAMEYLAMTAAKVRSLLCKSQAITNSMVYTLSSFDNRLSALQAFMRPIQAHTDVLCRAEMNITTTLNSIEGIIRKFDIAHQLEDQIQKGPQNNIRSYFKAVDELRSINTFFSSNNNLRSTNEVFIRTNNAFEMAVQRLEEKFKMLLESYSKPQKRQHLINSLPSSLQSSSGSSGKQDNNGAKNLKNAVYRLPNLIPPLISHQLRELTKQLAQVECNQQCLKIFKVARSLALERNLEKLGVEKLDEVDLQKMEWDVLVKKIGDWIQAMRIAVKVLFVAEQKVSDQIFDDIHYIKDQCFAEVTSNSMTMLLNFGDTIGRSERSPEKLFVLLDMYEVMLELQVEIETIFSGDMCSKIRDSAWGLTKCLAQAVGETFDTFEGSVGSDATKTTCFDGSVHPLTRYVINYMKYLFEYKSTFEQLQDSKSESKENFQFGNMIMRVLQALESNLDMKSKHYSDPALGPFFLMNNIYYMSKFVRRLDPKDFPYSDWIDMHKRVVQNNALMYKRSAWAKVVEVLSTKGLTSPGSDNSTDQSNHRLIVSKIVVKNRFKSFTALFDELHQKHCQWLISDAELCELLKLSISEILLPSYRNFYKHIGSKLKPTDLDKYAKYSPEDIENKLEDLFHGKPPSETKPVKTITE